MTKEELEQREIELAKLLGINNITGHSNLIGGLIFTKEQVERMEKSDDKS